MSHTGQCVRGEKKRAKNRTPENMEGAGKGQARWGEERKAKDASQDGASSGAAVQDLPAGKAGTSRPQPAIVDLTGGSEVGEEEEENTPLENWFPLVPVMLKRGPERQSGHLRSQDLQGFGGIPTPVYRSMRFMTLLFLTALAGALVCAYDAEAASASGSGNPSREASAAQEENAGEDPRLARQAPKPRKQRSSLLEKGLDGLENLGKEAVDNLENTGKAVLETIHDAKDVLDSALQL
nr:dermcidin [Callithrix jacchus]